METSKEVSFIVDIVRSDFSGEMPSVNGLNWEKLKQLIVVNRLFPLFYQYIKDAIPSEYKNEFKLEIEKNRLKTSNSLKEISLIKRECDSAKIRFVLVKGVGLSKLIYGDYFLRQSNDIDILVEEDDAPRLDYLLRKLGYIEPYNNFWEQDCIKLLPFPIMRLKHTNHYFEHYKLTEPYIRVEIHKYLYFVRPFIMEFIWNTEKTTLENIDVNTFTREYTLLFLLLNAYQNTESLYALQGQTILRDYIDINFFIMKYDHKTDWELIKRLSSKFGVLDKVYIVLSNLIELYPGKQVFKDRALLFSSILINNTNDINFLDSIFLVNERHERTQKMLKDKIFSKNKMLDAIEIYTENKDIALKEFRRYTNKLNIDIRYSIESSCNGIVFTFLLDKMLSSEFEKYMMQVSIFNNEKQNPNLYSFIEVTQNSGQYEASLYKTPIMRDSNVLRAKLASTKIETVFYVMEDVDMFSFTIPYESCFVEERENCLFAYEIDLFKFIYGYIYHFVEETPPDIVDAQVAFARRPSIACIATL